MAEKTVEERDIAAERALADRKATTRKKWAVRLSAFWVILTFGVALLADWSTLGLNEWGDFLAGSFAPLALLWLIVGYFQQADELRINSAAVMAQGRELSLQVSELKAQTQAHLDLVAVEREKLTSAALLRQQSIEPRFTVDQIFDAVAGQKLTIVNTGGTATNISVASAIDMKTYEIKPSSAGPGERFTVIHKAAGIRFERLTSTRPTRITCEDQHGVRYLFVINWMAVGGAKVEKLVEE